MLTSTSNTRADGNGLSLLRMTEPEVLAQPHLLYRAMREFDPVYWDPFMHAWVVTSYAEVVTVVTTYSSDRTPPLDQLDHLGLSFMKPIAQMMKEQMLFMDAPKHSRLRSLCSAAFTTHKVEALRKEIEFVAGELIDKSVCNGRIDLVSDFAAPLPAIMTAKLMGIPAKDHRQLGRWVNDIAELHGNFQHHPDRVFEIVSSLEEIKKYVAACMKELRVRPNEGLICSLMTAEVDGQRLTEEEVIASTIVTIIGGHETTTNLIANGFLTLMQNPASFEQLQKHPESIEPAVEELLRFESPVQHTARIAPADTQLGGKTILKGAKVIAVLAAANRDPNRFSDPDHLHLLRSDNRHLAFGWASHFCFGAPLARIEARIAFNSLLCRLSNPKVLDKELRWRENAGMRGLTGLEIGFDAGFVENLS